MKSYYFHLRNVMGTKVGSDIERYHVADCMDAAIKLAEEINMSDLGYYVFSIHEEGTDRFHQMG